MKTCLMMVMAGVLAAAGGAQGAVFSGSSGSKAAEAEFTVSGTNLILRLANISSADVLVPSDVLTAVFFSVAGPSLTLTRTSVVLGPTSIVVSGTTDPGNVVGGEWAYRSGLGGGAPRPYGFSSTGLGLFGPGDVFPGTNLAGPADPDGLQYGLLSAGDNTLTGNGGVLGTALIKHEVIATFGGLPADFDVSRISGVYFLYGTALGEGGFDVVPAPGALALAGIGGLLVARRRR